MIRIIKCWIRKIYPPNSRVIQEEVIPSIIQHIWEIRIFQYTIVIPYPEPEQNCISNFLPTLIKTFDICTPPEIAFHWD